MAAGFAYGMLTSLDRLMVLSFLGRTELGYYSLAFMAYGTMMLIPRSVSQMIYPRMAREYGRTGDPRSLRSLVYRPLWGLVAVMVPALAAVYVLGPWFIARFLPQYAPGIPAFRITLVGVFFLSFMGGFGNLLNVVDRQKLYLGIQVFALGLNFVLNLLALGAGWGFVGVAAATLATQVVYVLVLWACSHRVLAGEAGPA
jgi:O-antigen/teichoic acid export membrane protein